MKGSFAMTWSISHGGTQYGYSYSGIAELGERLMQAAGPTDQTHLRLIFSPRSGDPFEIEPWQAAEVGASLHRAARGLKFWDRSWAAMARQIADSALRAAKAGEYWRWS